MNRDQPTDELFVPPNGDGHTTFVMGEAIFLPPDFEVLLEQLTYAAQFVGGIQVVEGPAGSGKTVLANLLVDQYLTECHQLAFVAAGDYRGAGELLDAVADALGLAGDAGQSVGETLAGLRHYTQSLQAESQIAVLVIDDAHLLERDTAAALASLLQGGGESVFGLHLVLWSKPGTVAQLDELELVDIPVHDFAMPLLESKDVQAYLNFLADQGSDLVVGLDSAASDIASRCGGTIGGVRRLLEHSSDSFAEPADPEEDGNAGQRRAYSVAGLPVAHLAIVALLVVVLMSALVVWESEPERGPDRVAEQLSLPAEPQFVSGEAVAAPSMNTALPAARAGAVAVAKVDAVPESAPTEGSAASTGPAKAPKEGVVADLEPVVDERELRNAIYNSAPLAAPTPVDPSGANEPASKKVATAEKMEVKQQSPAPFKDSATLLAFAPDSFSLQVMAAGSLESVEAFRATQSNRADLYLYSTKRNGRDWYVLLAGHYGSHEAATKAIANLPQAQKSAGPWPRKLDSVQAEITANRSK